MVLYSDCYDLRKNDRMHKKSIAVRVTMALISMSHKDRIKLLTPFFLRCYWLFNETSDFPWPANTTCDETLDATIRFVASLRPM